jgi:hypothetical protein
VGSKFLAQDFSYFREILEPGAAGSMSALLIGYATMGIILVVIGAIVAWAFAEETHRGKLLMLAVSAPALITTWAGGSSSDHTAFHKPSFSLVDSAYAQTAPEMASEPTIWDGVKLFFGVGKEPPLYRVVVASYPDYSSAIAAAEAFNKEAPGIGARVADKKPPSDYYAVVVSDYLPYKDAKVRLDEAKKNLQASDAFLSPWIWKY